MWPGLIVGGRLRCQVVGRQTVNCRWLRFPVRKSKEFDRLHVGSVGVCFGRIASYVLARASWNDQMLLLHPMTSDAGFFEDQTLGVRSSNGAAFMICFHDVCVRLWFCLRIDPPHPPFHWSHVRSHIFFFWACVHERSSSYPVSVQELDLSSPNVGCLSWKRSPVYKLAWVKPHIMPALASIRVFALAHRWVPRAAAEHRLLNF